ncbi:MAG: ComF family protein [Candidatus Omnitrophica bacterium]|nr:ComF family protein [Candidatus Omnitrophota bacterium]
MIGRLIHGLRAIVYPKTCLSCRKKLAEKADDGFLCSQCRGKIKKNLPPFCVSCGRQLDKRWLAKNICPACQKNNLSFDRAYSPCTYEGVIKELIHKFKYNDREHLGEPLSRLMSEFIREYSLPIDYIDCIIPIPLHKTRLREREFNQSEVLSKYLAQEFNKELVSNAIERFRHTRTQTELVTHQRASNVKNSFRVTDPQAIKNKNILLIDDVLTTGATSSEAAAALKSAGANIVFVLTIAN